MFDLIGQPVAAPSERSIQELQDIYPLALFFEEQEVAHAETALTSGNTKSGQPN